MKRAVDLGEGDQLSEMAIVDTFTKLIFGQEREYSAGEKLIIEALRAVDTNVALDSHPEMGEYLRALGVRELVQLVSRVRERVVGSACVAATASQRAAINHRSN